MKDEFPRQTEGYTVFEGFPKAVEAYEISDGRLFLDLDMAKKFQQKLNDEELWVARRKKISADFFGKKIKKNSFFC